MIEDADIDIEALVIDDASMAFAEGGIAEFFCLMMVLQPRGLMTILRLLIQATMFAHGNLRYKVQNWC